MSMYYTGTCMDSFDEDGNCTNGFLPWITVDDFNVDKLEALPVSRDEFLILTYVDNDIIEGDSLFFKMGCVMVSYNSDTDIHSFFIN